jgi:hypothetical protein
MGWVFFCCLCLLTYILVVFLNGIYVRFSKSRDIMVKPRYQVDEVVWIKPQALIKLKYEKNFIAEYGIN